ncbi:glycogen debranching N-terminal domain-containing protein [Thermogutta sp.]|uniref:amylo-alpha-1,6-glucosidase n=1 Tax=Thermogutta sp. TaxID=1962930 RepID=UPI003C7A8B99
MSTGVWPFKETAVPEFYIPATSSLFERRPRTLKHGDTFAMFDHYGDIVVGDRTPEGIYHLDTRFLSRLILKIEGQRPLLLSSTVQRNNALLNVDLTNHDVFQDHTLVLPKGAIHIRRSKFLWQTACYEVLTLRNFDTVEHTFALTLEFGADFADLFEVRGFQREKRGHVEAHVEDACRLRFIYHSLDGLPRSTVVTFDPAPDRLTTTKSQFALRLGPKERCRIKVTVECQVDNQATHQRDFARSVRRARRALLDAAERAAVLETSNETVNEILCQSMADLTMLVTDTPWKPYPYAGIPWYSTAFGRDGLITAIEMLWIDPEIARGVLNFLAVHQATHDDPRADAEPGKILHEMRQCELARLGEIPFGQYYGSVDATPLFIILAGLYWHRTNDRPTLEALWPAVCRAFDWIENYGDRDGDGFVEYYSRASSGLTNQGWKDSGDAIFHADGRLAQPPIALVEVQGYVYLAYDLGVRLATEMNDLVLAVSLEEKKEKLRNRFEAAFWCDDLEFYALALDGNKTPCRVRTSNAGQLLFTGLPCPDRGQKVVRSLFNSDMFSGWGIRTVSRKEIRYNPASYHNGSVWPHDNALIGLGLSRYGFKEELTRLTTAILTAASHMDLRRLPELYCGFQRERDKGPTLYPVACAPQAWAAAAPFALLGACLGVDFSPATNTVRLVHPRLPPCLDWLTIRNLRLGRSRMDIFLQRHGDTVAAHVLKREGPVELEVIL